MEKVLKDGKVAVLYSPGFGAGWYSWNQDYKQLLFHPKLVEMVEQGKQKDLDEEFVKKELGLSEDAYIYSGGAEDLRIEWLPEGTKFTIQEYDGAESILLVDDLTITA